MREYNDRKDTNFQNYYYEQTKEASYIIPKMSEYEKNDIITKQFPWWVQEALASANFEDPNAIAHTLSNLDAIRSEKQARKENRSFVHANNSNCLNQQNAPQTVEIRGIQQKIVIRDVIVIIINIFEEIIIIIEVTEIIKIK